MWDESLLAGRIAATPAAPGFVLVLPWPSGRLEGCAGQLAEADVAILVSLLETEEAVGLGLDLAALGRACAARAVGWDHAPIVDFAVPDAAFERRWHRLGAALQEQLGKGRGVALHCRGGLGRSGTIAARLLIELGLDPGEAIARVRESRPGAIETGAQEAYLHALGRRSRDAAEPFRATPEPVGGATHSGSHGAEEPPKSQPNAYERKFPRR